MGSRGARFYGGGGRWMGGKIGLSAQRAGTEPNITHLYDIA